MITYTLCLLYIFDMSISHSFNHTTHGEKVVLSPRVVNGWPAKHGDVPYQVAFKRSIQQYKYSTFCGGTIIGPAKVLSAAHCFTDTPSMFDKMCGSTGVANKKTISHYYAVAGQLQNVAVYHHHDSPEDGQWRRLKKVLFPPEYNFPKLDIALVFLYSPFIYNSYVNSIPYASKLLDYHGKCLVSGFGRISNKMTSEKLLLAHLTLVPMRKCSSRHRKNMHLFVCTSSQFTDVGKGDSGGPLVCANTGDPKDKGKGVLVGIVSGHAYGIGSFFTRVSAFYNYIERNKSTSENGKCISLMPMVLFNLIHWRFSLF